MEDNKQVPKKLSKFMYALMKEARRQSFTDLLESWGIDYDTEYEEIREWFAMYGIKL